MTWIPFWEYDVLKINSFVRARSWDNLESNYIFVSWLRSKVCKTVIYNIVWRKDDGLFILFRNFK